MDEKEEDHLRKWEDACPPGTKYVLSSNPREGAYLTISQPPTTGDRCRSEKGARNPCVREAASGQPRPLSW